MTGKAQHVNVHPFHINRQKACCLGRVYNEQRSIFVTHGPKLFQIIDIAGQI